MGNVKWGENEKVPEGWRRKVEWDQEVPGGVLRAYEKIAERPAERLSGGNLNSLPVAGSGQGQATYTGGGLYDRPRLTLEEFGKLPPAVGQALSDCWNQIRQDGTMLQGVADQVAGLERQIRAMAPLTPTGEAALKGAEEKLEEWMQAFGHLQACAAPNLIVDADHPAEFAQRCVESLQAERKRWAAREVGLDEKLAHTELELEEYRLRLAGALTVLDGHPFDPDEPGVMPVVANCPTIRTALRIRQERDDARASLKAIRESNILNEKAGDYAREKNGRLYAEEELRQARGKVKELQAALEAERKARQAQDAKDAEAGTRWVKP